MSPATLRRYRAQRLLERDFAALRGSVLASVRARLRSSAGTALDEADLEACYATAWQGLYASALAGEEILNPRAWLVLVTYRRAIEELRAPRRHDEPLDGEAVSAHDIETELDDRDRLRSLLHGMRARLDAREREAAALCYLHGYSRAEAARLMGLSDTRMRKLMEGNKGRAGVSAKVGALAETIRRGGFCEQQGSLMRALAYGVLDPDGERYALAVRHRRDCPACRRYVATLRGAAVVLPPVLTLPGAGSLLAGAGLAHHIAAGQASVSLGASAASGGGAGGSLAISAGLGAKLAAGCLLAVGVGAGCVAIEHSSGHRHPHDRHAAPQAAAALAIKRPAAARRSSPRAAPSPGSHGGLRSRPRSAPAPRAGQEFGIEQPVATTVAPLRSPRASIAAAGSGKRPAGQVAGAAAREFSPG